MKTRAVEIKEDDEGHYTIECDLPMMPIPIVERIVNEVAEKVRQDKTTTREILDKTKELEQNILDTVETGHKVIAIQKVKILILWVVVIFLLLFIITTR